MATGDDLELGALNNSANEETRLTVNKSSQPGFHVSNSGGGTESDPVTGIFGEASGSSKHAVGVRGETTKAGIGVRGKSNEGVGVHGDATSTGTGVLGSSKNGLGVEGTSGSNIGVHGFSTSSVGVKGEARKQDGVQGFSDIRNGVYGQSGNASDIKDGIGIHDAAGVLGWSWVDYGVRGVSMHTNDGVRGESALGFGVHGISLPGSAVMGESNTGIGVRGISGSGAGVHGKSTSAPGVSAESDKSHGVLGTSSAKAGVLGKSLDGIGVIGVQGNVQSQEMPQLIKKKGSKATYMIAIYGVSHDGGTGVYGESKGAGDGVRGDSDSGIGVHGRSKKGWAGYFDGNVYVKGDFTKTGQGSCVAIPFQDGSLRKLHSIESPESWFEDFGESKLVNGKADIRIDADFANVVHGDYHIFLTPYGDSNGLYVSAKARESFEVREQKGGTASLDFSYRLIARRKDVARCRFERIIPPTDNEVKRRATDSGMQGKAHSESPALLEE